MSVEIGTLKDRADIGNGDILIMAPDYDAAWLRFEQGEDEVVILREHLPQLAKIIDRLLDSA